MNFLLRHVGSIKAKLFIGFTLISVVTVLAVSILSMLPMHRIEMSLRSLGHGNFQALIRINVIRDAQSRILASERTLLIRQLSDQKIRRENYASIENSFRRAEEASSGFEALLGTPFLVECWEKFRAAWEMWSQKQNELLDMLRNQDALLAEGVQSGRQFDRVANQAFDAAFSELRDFRNQSSDLLDDLVDMLQKNAQEELESSLTSLRSNEFWQLMFSLVAFIGSLAFSFWLSIRISRPILQAVNHIVQVADGNLTQNMNTGDLAQTGESGLLANAIQKLIESQRREVRIFKTIAGGDYTCSMRLRSDQDELGQAVRRMIGITNETLSRVNLAVSQVAAGAGTINNASQSLSQGAIETAASLEEISASITQIDEKTKANAVSADTADKLASSSRTVVEKGYEAVAEMISAMKDIQVTSTQIASVLKLIDDIAFQTNLLALNAAVEAARAGRHGRGFSIVADEVRSLAGRSAKAAKETAQMLEKTVGKLERGAIMAEHTDAVLREIVDNAAKVAELFREIAKSSNEQSQGIGQIANGLSQIDRVTQHNTLTASETASAAITLLRQAEGLRAMMERFRLMENGGQGRAGRAARPDAGPRRLSDTRNPALPDSRSIIPLTSSDRRDFTGG